MNTIVTQLNDKQYDDMMALLHHAMMDYESDLDHAVDDESEADAKEMLAKHEAVVQALTATKAYLWTESLGRIELEIPASIVDEVAQSGDNLPAVEAALCEHPYVVAQLDRIDSKVLEQSIDEVGIEQPAYTMNIRTMHQYLLWMACWDIHEAQYQED